MIEKILSRANAWGEISYLRVSARLCKEIRYSQSEARKVFLVCEKNVRPIRTTTVFIRLNAAVFIKFLACQMRVYWRAAFISKSPF